MWSGVCGAMSVAGWVIMAALWMALIAAVLWGITRLFPAPPRVSGPSRPTMPVVRRRRRRSDGPEHVASSLSQSGRR